MSYTIMEKEIQTYKFYPKTWCQTGIWIFTNNKPSQEKTRPRNIRDKMVASFVSTGVHTAANILECNSLVLHNGTQQQSSWATWIWCFRKSSDEHSHYSTKMKHQKQVTPHFLQNIPTQLPTKWAYRTDTASCDPFLDATLKADYKLTDIWTSDKAKVDATCSSTMWCAGLWNHDVPTLPTDTKPYL